ncbi:MAG: hypothetical protein ABDI07_11455, partial [Candidatus Kryptonium sp.]
MWNVRMSDYLQSLENQGFKSDIPKMAHYVRLADYNLPTNDNVTSNTPFNVPSNVPTNVPK